MANYLFLGGHPKSGTTLLLSLLDSHPSLCVYPEELKWYSEVVKINRRSDRIIHILTKTGAYIPKLNDVDFSSGRRSYTHIPSAQYFSDLVDRLLLSNNNKDMLSAIFNTWLSHNNLEKKNIGYFVEKTPGNEMYYTNSIKRDYPDSKLISTIRDPRDNFYTYKKKHPELTIAEFCVRWKKSLRSSAQVEGALTVRYEDLVEKPKETMAAVARFLVIDYKESLLTPTRGGGGGQATVCLEKIIRLRFKRIPLSNDGGA